MNTIPQPPIGTLTQAEQAAIAAAKVQRKARRRAFHHLVHGTNACPFMDTTEASEWRGGYIGMSIEGFTLTDAQMERYQMGRATRAALAELAPLGRAALIALSREESMSIGAAE